MYTMDLSFWLDTQRMSVADVVIDSGLGQQGWLAVALFTSIEYIDCCAESIQSEGCNKE